MNKFSSITKSAFNEDLEICILSTGDIFGYQELLETDIDVRSCTVKCLKNDSRVVSISKASLVTLIRRSPTVLEEMKLKWTQFLV